MKNKRLEWMVGVFVLVGLVLLGALLIQFSKGASWLRPSYELHLRATNIGGLKNRAAVLMSGVQVGNVSAINLSPDGRSVMVTLQLFRRFTVHRDAQFAIEQSGFLGDQYVAIKPTENKLPVFEDGDTADAQEPFDLQSIIGNSTSFMQRFDQTVRKLDEAISNLNQTVLSPQALTNLSVTVSNLRAISARAVATVDRLDELVITSGPAVTLTLSNTAVFSSQLTNSAGRLQQLLDTNAPSLEQAVKNIESSTEMLKAMLMDVQAGKGVAGKLLRDDQMATNIAAVAYNLSVTSSNLNRRGLWGILWKQPPPKKTGDEQRLPQPLVAPKDSFH